MSGERNRWTAEDYAVVWKSGLLLLVIVAVDQMFGRDPRVWWAMVGVVILLAVLPARIRTGILWVVGAVLWFGLIGPVCAVLATAWYVVYMPFAAAYDLWNWWQRRRQEALREAIEEVLEARERER